MELATIGNDDSMDCSLSQLMFAIFWDLR